jgi:hypothetical protein
MKITQINIYENCSISLHRLVQSMDTVSAFKVASTGISKEWLCDGAWRICCFILGSMPLDETRMGILYSSMCSIA